ncbi:hypothetical protein [Zavarzinella formosa]|uniref:hypothetical protein n=1 Tax=Zavarzinella formosa TaxID=360055 RepID=UPI0002FBC65C|nr:hypothetical protein [Zavarzinella formosa]
MEQKFEVVPKAELRLEGRKVVRTPVANDWGLRLQWVVTRDGKVIAMPNARLGDTLEHPDKTPGKYEVVLQMWKYVNYKKNADGEFTDSKFIDISNKVAYTI